MKFLGIIPARSGSKGVKNKNIKLVNGKPLISYSIIAAQKSKFLNKIIVSTDSSKIANIALKYSAEVPFLRPKKLATDQSLIIDTLKFTLIKTEKMMNERYDYVVLIQPTAPNRQNGEIDKCIKKFLTTGADSLITLTKIDEPHPYKLKIINGKYTKNFIKSAKDNFPRQLLPNIYKPSGNLYIYKRSLILKKQTTGKKQTFFITNEKDFLNIDSHVDIEIAKMKLKKMK